MNSMKTIICAEYQKETILRHTAAAGGGAAFGIDVRSFSNYLHTDEDAVFRQELELAAKLRSESARFPIYKTMLSFPAFIQEILSFAKECALYEIDPDTLPASDTQKEQLREIIRAALTLSLQEKKMAARRDALILSLKNRKDVSLYPYFENRPFYYRLREELSAFLPYEQLPEYKPDLRLMYAMDPRQEIEAAAQHICASQQPCVVILTSPSSQMPVLEEVFGRYQIPFSAVHQNFTPKISAVFHCLIRLAAEKDIPSFADALREDAFPVFFPDTLISFIETTMTDFSAGSDMFKNVRESIFSDEAENLENLKDNAGEMMNRIMDELSLLLSAKTPGEMLKNAFTVLRRSPFLKNPAELSAAMKIRSAVSDVMPMIKTAEDLDFFASSVCSRSFAKEISLTDFCTVTDLTRPVAAKENTYVIGCSGRNYPGTPTRTGLFDERYLSECAGYPSDEERFAIYKKQLDWVRRSAAGTVYYSYPVNDYQGREIQPAFEIEAAFKKADKWPLAELKPASLPEHKLSKETASLLFARGGAVHGSISTIERWFQCPYSYFIQSGLKVRAAETAGADSASAGSVQHALAEEAVNQFGKRYAEITDQEIKDFLRPSFDALRSMNPHNSAVTDLIEERMSRSLRNALDYLKVYESYSLFSPACAEKRFGRPAEEDVEITDGVLLRGTIDRLDTCREMMRIIDYKSSDHSLSETKIKAGLQLQLLTYMIIAEKMENKTPVGAYYFSFKGDSLKIPAAKATAKQITDTEWTQEAEDERVLSLYKLKGWTFEDRFTELDDNQKFISPRTVYDYSLVRKCIISLYDYFRDALSDGRIDLDPTEGACMFCDYKPVCRFHGEPRKAEPLVFEDISLKKGESRE